MEVLGPPSPGSLKLHLRRSRDKSEDKILSHIVTLKLIFSLKFYKTKYSTKIVYPTKIINPNFIKTLLENIVYCFRQNTQQPRKRRPSKVHYKFVDDRIK